MTPPVIIENNAQKLLGEWLDGFSEKLGRPILQSQSEYALASAAAYRESLWRAALQAGAIQNLVDFATVPALDYLGRQQGVVRLAAEPATTIIEFTLLVGHTGTIIPAATAVATKDGAAVFITDDEIYVAPGVTTGSVAATCEDDGVSGNGYAIGFVSTIQTPIVNVLSAANTTLTGGGAAEETDEKLRARIIAAPAGFTTAGSKAAYRFHALSAHPDILDARAYGGPAGTVNVRLLMYGAIPPSPTVIAVTEAALSDEKVRPLSDTVIVTGVTNITYTENINITALSSAVPSDVLAGVTAAITALQNLAKANIGMDVTVTMRIAAAQNVPGVYSVAHPTPQTDLVAGQGDVIVGSIGTIQITSTVNG